VVEEVGSREGQPNQKESKIVLKRGNPQKPNTKSQTQKAKYKKPNTKSQRPTKRPSKDQGQPVFDAPQHPNHQAFKIKKPMRPVRSMSH